MEHSRDLEYCRHYRHNESKGHFFKLLQLSWSTKLKKKSGISFYLFLHLLFNPEQGNKIFTPNSKAHTKLRDTGHGNTINAMDYVIP